jgi:hypothetical protein
MNAVLIIIIHTEIKQTHADDKDNENYFAYITTHSFLYYLPRGRTTRLNIKDMKSLHWPPCTEPFHFCMLFYHPVASFLNGSFSRDFQLEIP